MKALGICKNLLKAITKEEIVQGHVHSIFNSACNIETDHWFITLLGKDKGMAPMSVIVDGGEKINFKNLQITQNMNFYFSENGIYCKEKNIFISLYGVRKWSPKIMLEPFNCLENKLLENIRIMELGLISQGRLYGIGSLVSMLSNEVPELGLLHFQACSQDKSFEFIKCRFLKFIQAFVTGDVKDIAEISENVIGFGTGLTPAMDDFISGFMISFIYLGNYYKLNISKIYKLNIKIISKGLNKTTRVSSEMLKHSSVGEINQWVKELMEELLKPDNEKNIMKALLNVIGVWRNFRN